MNPRFPAGSLIAVTGPNGFIGSHIVKDLLASGFRVRAVVRDLANTAKYAHLKALPTQTPNQLEFAQAELQASQYEQALQGCDAVIHTATPYRYTAPDPQKEIVDPAVEGTLSVLRACAAIGVSRAVITSSGTAFMHFPVPDGYTFTVDDWNLLSTLENNPYWLSKRVAEQAAWAFAKEHPAVEVVVVNPVYVLGPTLSPSLNMSLGNVRRLLLGEPGMPLIGHVPVVDVRDVSRAHVIAVSTAEAKGMRLFCSERVIAWAELAETLAKLFPKYPNFKDYPPFKPPHYTVDTAPLAALGLDQYIAFEQTVKDCGDSLIEHKVIEDKR